MDKKKPKLMTTPAVTRKRSDRTTYVYVTSGGEKRNRDAIVPF